MAIYGLEACVVKNWGGKAVIRRNKGLSGRLEGLLERHEWSFVSVTVGLAIATTIFVAFGFIESSGRLVTPDAIAYYDMSFHPFERPGDAPYSYRLLTPFLVSLVPTNHLTGFGIVNSVGFVLLLFLVYYYVRSLSDSKVYGLIGVAFLASCPVFVYTVSNTCLIDSISFVFLAAAFVALKERNDKLYALVLALGVLNKETVLLTLPLYFLLALEKKTLLASLGNSIAVALPALIVLLGIRIYFGLGEYHSTDMIDYVLSFHRHEGFLKIGFLVYSAFGVLWILLLFGARRVDSQFLRCSLLFIPLAIAQLVIATDAARMLFVAFPVLIPFAVVFLREPCDSRLRFLVVVSTVLLTILPVAGMAIYYWYPDLVDPGIHNMYLDLSLLALQSTLATAVLICHRR